MVQFRISRKPLRPTTLGYSPLFRRSIFPKVHCSEGSLFRRFIVPKKRFIVPKVYWSEGSFIRNRGSLLRRFIVPKVHCSEIEVHCSEGSFIRNRGLLLRRLIIPKVQYSEISHLSDRNMLICYDKYEMIRIFGRATIVHIQAKLGKEMHGSRDESDDTVLQTQDSHHGSLEVEHATSRSRRFPPIFSFANGWRKKCCYDNKNIMIAG